MILNNIDSAYVGADQAEKIYLGTEQIYPSGTPPEPSYEGEYFTIETLGNGDFYVRSEVPYYSINGGEWAHPLTGTPLSLNQGDKVRFKATPNAKMSGLFSGNTLAFKVYGNIESLDYGDNFTGATQVKLASGFTSYFYNCTGLTEAHNLVLPATTLANWCYYNMFMNCTSLISVPVLPATALIGNCYYCMFQGCTSLTSAPVLPATTLASRCYSNMFHGCTSLTTAPALPATTLAELCYEEMFSGCTSLTSAPVIPATALTNSCYYQMFAYCTSLTTAPALPATTLNSYCYNQMFMNCTSLISAPVLPATALIGNCYSGMFTNCTSLTSAPVLPATTLANGCYDSMFSGCASLTTAPELPAQALTTTCYRAMFRGCTNLTYIKCLVTNTSGTGGVFGPTGNWLAGVSPTGTFVKKAGVTWSTGSSGIPSGWTVIEE